MKSLLFIALITICFSASSCEQPYRLQVGAFFDSSSVVTFWSDFTKEIAIHTKCPTNMHPAKSYKQHIIDTLNFKGDIFIVPSYYVPIFERYGLKNIISSNTPNKTYLVTKKQYDPNNLESLRGSSIQLVSPYSAAYLLMVNKLEDMNLSNAVTLKFGSSFQSNAMSVVRGNMDAAVIISLVFDTLPDSIKNKVNYKTITESIHTGSIMVKPDAPKQLSEAIIAAKDSIKLLKWVNAKSINHTSELTEYFQLQVNELLKNQTDNQTNK